MGNTLNMNLLVDKKNKKHDFFTHLADEKILDLKNNYKIIDVDYLDPILVHCKMFDDDYFKLHSNKENVVNNMLDYYLNHDDTEIYKKTNYLCDYKEKICICNTHANDLRKIYDGINYKPDEKYISWIKF